jgi:hypothetical protein
MYPLTFEAMGQAHGFVLYETLVEQVSIFKKMSRF